MWPPWARGNADPTSPHPGRPRRTAPTESLILDLDSPAMATQRNFLPLAGFLVCLLGFFSYFFVFVRFPVTRDVPWANWLLFAVGLALAGAGIARAFRRPETYR